MAEHDDLTAALIAELDAALGDRFIGLIRYGAMCFPPSPVTDYDAHVFVADPFTDDDRTTIRAAWERLATIPGGDDMDVWYVTMDEASSSEGPQTQMNPGQRDGAWALHRAHWHAGKVVVVKGEHPNTFVPEPVWEEIDTSLQGDLADLRGHFAEHPAYVVLNVCRVLYTYETRDVVTGKFQSAIWAIASLPLEHHAMIRSAIEGYVTKSYAVDGDVPAFFEEMSGRIARARGSA